ncbi:hypothetical protein bplSymb_SCF24901P001 [Bathymodiolus platifrons methanotrophic gill symbiont]|uniref:DUF1566 domain-containing protein n=1 Tax=Bathymodiolus platifrons methanotrophic gill symbiont TaxID=113268 RepID=UPI000B417441|nr:DUF1566 domain-containing protein [Bathymodiolus platifrons methanotrophic gill symbiont]GAW87882.1 hypothetical protein bplSymb_SCF24901P001 [Bathymodiolus platifrons methanotrophic gill symbiont]
MKNRFKPAVLSSIIVSALALVCTQSANADFDFNEYLGNQVFDCSNDTNLAEGACHYSVGDTGPAGGKVFFVSKNGSHGLEVSPIDAVVGGESEFEWGCYKIDPIGSEEMGLGGGSMNTRMIIDECVSELNGPTAADVADNFEYGGFDDWYLPSHDELHSLRVNLKDKGLLEMEYDAYWSSSETKVDRKYRLNDPHNDRFSYVEFVGGAYMVNDLHGGSKDIKHFVRPVRSF